MAITKLHSHIINLMMHGSSLFIKDSNSLSYMKTTANIFQSLFSFCYCLWKFFSVYIFIIWPNLQLFYTICFHYFFFVEKLSLPSNQENIPCSFFFQVYMMFVLLCFFDCFSSLIGLEYNLGMV